LAVHIQGQTAGVGAVSLRHKPQCPANCFVRGIHKDELCGPACSVGEVRKEHRRQFPLIRVSHWKRSHEKFAAFVGQTSQRNCGHRDIRAESKTSVHGLRTIKRGLIQKARNLAVWRKLQRLRAAVGSIRVRKVERHVCCRVVRIADGQTRGNGSRYLCINSSFKNSGNSWYAGF